MSTARPAGAGPVSAGGNGIGLRDRPGHAGPANGGVPARRAVIRWAWRLLRGEWRQQLLILALITVAVAATFIGAAVATNSQASADATFGTATDLIHYPGTTPDLAGQIAGLQRRFGRVDVIATTTVPVPGSIQTYDLRAQDPHGPYGQPLLSLVSGRYPAGASQVALTSGVAAELGLKTGDDWRSSDGVRRVVGIVADPADSLASFALVAPGQIRTPAQVTVLFDAPRVPLRALGPGALDRQSAAATSALNPATISLAAATLGMLLIALVSVAGFTVLAQRRLRSIGMLGAQGATDASIRLVVRANGTVTGLVGAIAGGLLGLLAWIAYRPADEASAHHEIGIFQLPWLVIGVSMILAVLAASVAAARPARAIARVPIVAALAGRPPAPRKVRSWSTPAGVGLLVLAFFLVGLASEDQGASMLVLGLLVLSVGVVLISPACLGALAGAGRRAPVVIRLALRDLSRYRARSGAALGAISLSVLIAVIICVASAARFASNLDYAGPNLGANQLVVYTPTGNGHAVIAPPPSGGSGGHHPSARLHQQGPPPNKPVTAAQLSAMAARAHAIAASLGAGQATTLLTTDTAIEHAAAGRNWHGPVYVATPQLLRAFGIDPASVSPSADILTMRSGLSTMSKMQLLYGKNVGGGPDGGSPGTGQTSWPCPPGECVANPGIQEVSALPSGTSAPNTVITEHAIHLLGLTTTTAGWLIQAPSALTPTQITSAQQTAGASGLSVETRNSIPTLAEIIDVATVFGILLALGILAMSVGLVRSETASQLRTLAATGASASARRAISAVTAGALAFSGALVGTIGGYVAAFGFFRTSQLDSVSSLASIPVANLLLILVAMPLVAVAGGWLLGGREPDAVARAPQE